MSIKMKCHHQHFDRVTSEHNALLNCICVHHVYCERAAQKLGFSPKPDTGVASAVEHAPQTSEGAGPSFLKGRYSRPIGVRVTCPLASTRAEIAAKATHAPAPVEILPAARKRGRMRGSAPELPFLDSCAYVAERLREEIKAISCNLCLGSGSESMMGNYTVGEVRSMYCNTDCGANT